MTKKNSFERIEEMEVEEVQGSFTPNSTKKYVTDNLGYVRNSGALVESFFTTTIKLVVSLLGGAK